MMIDRYKKIIMLLIVLIGFGLRYYAANSVGINSDEMIDYPSAEKISFNLKNLNLPLIDNESNGPMGFKYLVKLGWNIFGKTLLGARLPFVILGVLTILMVYFLVRSTLGINTALLASFLLAISQYHIGQTKAPNSSGLIFLAFFSLFLFYKGIRSSNKNLILINGLVLGVSYWFREYLLLLIPVYIIFLLVCPEYRALFKNKYIWISFVLPFCIALPIFYLNLNVNTPRISYIRNLTSIGVSMNAVGLYLGELILFMVKPFPKIFEYAASTRDAKMPVETFVFGFMILMAVVGSIKNKKPFIKLLSVCFLFNFVLFSFVRPVTDGLSSFWSLGNMHWSSIGFIPGVILAANMLTNFIKRKRFYGGLLLEALAVFMLIRAVDYVAFPLDSQVPIRYFQIGRNYLYDVEIWIKEGDIELAKDVLQRVYKVTDKRPALKQRAALRLAQILIEEGKYEDSREYLDYLLLQDSYDSKAVRLLEELKGEYF